MPQLQTEGLPLKAAKINYLKALLPFIPPIHKDFYNQLYETANSEEDNIFRNVRRGRGRPRKLLKILYRMSMKNFWIQILMMQGIIAINKIK